MNAAETAVVSLAVASGAACVIGRFVGLSARGLPRTSYQGCPDGVEARTICAEFASPGGVAIGREVLLQFEGGDPERPMVVGLIQPSTLAVRVDDGAVLSLKADRRIELVCGKASIVLNADGKIVIKGAHLLSRSSGPNKIRGATVELN